MDPLFRAAKTPPSDHSVTAGFGLEGLGVESRSLLISGLALALALVLLLVVVVRRRTRKRRWGPNAAVAPDPVKGLDPSSRTRRTSTMNSRDDAPGLPNRFAVNPALPYLRISLAEEQLWQSVCSHFSPAELALVTPDLKFRDIAGSRFLAPHTGKQLQYLVTKVRAQVQWIPSARPSTILSRQKQDFPLAAEFRRLILPCSIHGNDFKGNPIILFDLSSSDWKQAAKADFAQADVLLDYVTLHQEAMLHAVRQRSALAHLYGVIQPPYTAVFNFSGLTVARCKHGFDLGFSKIASLWGSQYPETLAKVYVCNAPMLLMVIWRIVSPFIEPDTLEKIKILAPGAHLAEFAKDKIPLSHIPQSLGGTSLGEYVIRDDGDYNGSPGNESLLDKSSLSFESARAEDVAASAESGVGEPHAQINRKRASWPRTLRWRKKS